MWSRALRRPLGCRLHRTVRFARRYNGRTQEPHTTYFQTPPPAQSRSRFLRTSILAITSFGLGIYAAPWLTDYGGDADEDEEDNEAVTLLGFPREEVVASLDAYVHLLSAKAVPPVDLRFAQEILDKQKGFTIGNGCVGHHCFLPSNLPCEDTASGGEYTFFSDQSQNWSFCGIYDGHAGPKTADELQSILPSMLGDRLWKGGCMSRPYVPNDSVIVQTIKDAFKGVDTAMMERAEETARSSGADMSLKVTMCAPVLSGSCALLALVDPKNSILRVANAGDSRAVLGRWDKEAGKYIAKPMSVDQTGFNPDEVERLRREHPGEEAVDPKTGRVFGIAVSRAFGDARWKWPNEFTQFVHEKLFGPAPRPNGVIKTPPYLTAEPEVMEEKIQTGEKPDFLIMASDGLWDNMSSENAVICVQQWLDKFEPTKFMKPDEATNMEEMWRHEPFQRSEVHEPVPYDTTKDDDTYYDENERCLRWRVEPKHFVVEDDNCSTHLIKNALGGNRRNLYCGIMGMQPPLSRNVRDDITVAVLFFGVDATQDVKNLEALQRGRDGKDKARAKKIWGL